MIYTESWYKEADSLESQLLRIRNALYRDPLNKELLRELHRLYLRIGPQSLQLLNKEKYPSTIANTLYRYYIYPFRYFVEVFRGSGQGIHNTELDLYKVGDYHWAIYVAEKAIDFLKAAKRPSGGLQDLKKAFERRVRYLEKDVPTGGDHSEHVKTTRLIDSLLPSAYHQVSEIYYEIALFFGSFEESWA